MRNELERVLKEAYVQKILKHQPYLPPNRIRMFPFSKIDKNVESKSLLSMF